MVSLSEREGSFVPKRRFVHLKLKGVSTHPDRVLANGEDADWSYEEAEDILIVRLVEGAGEVAVEVKF